MHVTEWAEQMAEKAKAKTKPEPFSVEFNGTEITVHSGMCSEWIVDRWSLIREVNRLNKLLEPLRKM
jgi:hypothetical protein